jgi:hypothetical protein
MLVCLTAAILLLTVIPLSQQQVGGAQQQYSWMPQGRFGKRFKDSQSIEDSAVQALLNTGAELRMSDSVHDLSKPIGKLRFADVPMIQADSDGIFCLQTTFTGYYRCFRDLKLGEVASTKK